MVNLLLKIYNLKSKIPNPLSLIPYPQSLIPLLLFSAGLYSYTRTLAPTVLDGDAALFQYTPYVLGVTYPTGFPLYILLGKLWVTIFPFGEIAWRMNLLSAICAAIALPLIYEAASRLLNHRAAMVTVLIFATMPTFWRWATEAKTYAVNILLLSSILYILTKTVGQVSCLSTNDRQDACPTNILLASFLLGLSVSVHNTMLLLAPGLILFLGLQNPTRKLILQAIGLFLLPNLCYLYIPLRAEWLIAHYGRADAIGQGLLADFYTSGLAGLVRYFTAADFTGGVVKDWGLVPGKFFPVYVANLLVDEVGKVGVLLGVLGGLSWAVKQPRLFWPFFLIYALPIPFVLAYGQGEQSAFLLPSFLIFCLFIGYAIKTIEDFGVRSKGTSTDLQSVAKTVADYKSLTPYFLLLTSYSLLLIFFLIPRVNYGFNWLEAKWNRAIYDEWTDALNHPMESGASVLAHWGDLTPFWYLQHAEQRRPDLRGLYPPTEAIVSQDLQSGRALYIAGPLQGWASGIETRYQLIPWGRLVRIAPPQVQPQTLLPTLPLAISPEHGNFANQLQLLQADVPTICVGGAPCPITLNWQALAELSPQTVISLRLSHGSATVAQLDDSLLSGWFPRDTLPAKQYILSYSPVPIPRGILPGRYRLQLVVYVPHQAPWTLPNGTTMLDVGQVEITSPLVAPTLLARHDFNGEMALLDYRYSARRVRQGKDFTLRLLWQARAQPLDNYTLIAELVDARDHVWQTIEHQPTNGQLPTAAWQQGQFVRDEVNILLPASTPAGEQTIRVRLSWQRPDRSKLPLRDWILPRGHSLALEWLNVMEKEGRVFTPPAITYPLKADVEDKIRLLGYNITKGNLYLKQADDCSLEFNFYWQALQEMAQSYTVFLHMVDKNGQIVAQTDKVPGLRGKQPTTGWLTGEVITDPLVLSCPNNLSPGQYSLRLGLYIPPNGARLQIATADFIEIGKLELE